jgi:cytochrome d ubiquinol oxidase subunit II
MVMGLILRGVAFEFRSKREDQKWRNRWDWAIFIGSLIPALLWGVTIANLMRGFAITADKHYYGGLLPLLNPYALFGGVVFVGLFTLHGAGYLGIKISGPLKQKIKDLAAKFWIPVVLLSVIFLVWTFLATDILANPGFDGLIPAILAAVALLLFGYFLRQGREGWTFVSGGAAVLLATIMVFAGLYPDILISTLDPAYNLTVYNSAGSAYSLRLFTIVGAILIPAVLAYQGWTYWIFRERISPDSDEVDLHY